jgi:hypothetical protein
MRRRGQYGISGSRAVLDEGGLLGMGVLMITGQEN